MNWISPTGLSPCAAIPTQSPLIRASDSGVSKTRSTPKRCCKPAVARKTPPLTPTSSPKTTTLGSSARARASAKLIASTSVTSGILVLDFLTLAGIGARQSGIEMVEHGFRWTRPDCQITLDRRIYAFLAFMGDFLLLRLIPTHPADEISPQSGNRLLLPALLDFLRRAITRRIISCGVVAESIGDGLDKARPFPRTSRRDRHVDCSAYGNNIVAVHLLSA